VCGENSVHFHIYCMYANLMPCSGKSTLLLTLLRLDEVLHGRITIGNENILHFQRDSIRKSVTVIPQDPALFPGRLRYNLDPEGSYSDTEIREVLSRVGLSEIVSSPQGLDMEMTQSTLASLSRGELQLLALARALLRRHDKAALLVMDEVTSSTDTATEETIMQIVREDFAKSTVIAVAHRLNTILDFDLVFVMDQGRIREVGRPKELLENPSSIFARLYNT
jgi:ATP-binding cassette subfamily C (CFTR/MRP) protein 1